MNTVAEIDEYIDKGWQIQHYAIMNTEESAFDTALDTDVMCCWPWLIQYLSALHSIYDTLKNWTWNTKGKY